MKKACVLLLSVCFVSFLGAQESAVFRVSMLIEDNLFENEMKISESAKGLTTEERRMIYDDYKKDPTVAVIENVFIGCGLGSFLQGDRSGGWTGLFGDLLGLGVMIYGVSQIDSGLYGDPYNYNLSDNKGFVAFSLGGGIVLAARLYELIRPIKYSERYNKTLRSALDPGLVSFGVVPMIDPEASGVGVAIRVSLR